MEELIELLTNTNIRILRSQIVIEELVNVIEAYTFIHQQYIYMKICQNPTTNQTTVVVSTQQDLKENTYQLSCSNSIIRQKLHQFLEFIPILLLNKPFPNKLTTQKNKESVKYIPVSGFPGQYVNLHSQVMHDINSYSPQYYNNSDDQSSSLNSEFQYKQVWNV